MIIQSNIYFTVMAENEQIALKAIEDSVPLFQKLKTDFIEESIVDIPEGIDYSGFMLVEDLTIETLTALLKEVVDSPYLISHCDNIEVWIVENFSSVNSKSFKLNKSTIEEILLDINNIIKR